VPLDDLAGRRIVVSVSELGPELIGIGRAGHERRLRKRSGTKILDSVGLCRRNDRGILTSGTGWLRERNVLGRCCRYSGGTEERTGIVVQIPLGQHTPPEFGTILDTTCSGGFSVWDPFRRQTPRLLRRAPL
jgi:hypothetical protein